MVLQTACKIKEALPHTVFCLSLAREDLRQSINKALKSYPQLNIRYSRDNYSAIKAADLVIAKSGTVNLETALMGVPQIVFYRLNSFSSFVVKHLLKVNLPKFISPVNLMLRRKVVPEYIQDEANAENLSKKALEILLETKKDLPTLG